MYPGARYFHITVSFSGEPNYKVIQDELNSELEWMMYGPGSFLVYSQKTVQQLSDKIHKHLGTYDVLLVIEVNFQNRQGWLYQWMWDWINKKR